jgi:plasmid stability protein
MRTTINLDDEVFRAYKQRAAARGTTLSHEIQDALRADLHSRRQPSPTERFETLVFEGDGSPALVDIDDNRALSELTDAEEATSR